MHLHFINECSNEIRDYYLRVLSTVKPECGVSVWSLLSSLFPIAVVLLYFVMHLIITPCGSVIVFCYAPYYNPLWKCYCIFVMHLIITPCGSVIVFCYAPYYNSLWKCCV